MKFPPAPKLQLKWANIRGHSLIFFVQCIKVRGSNAETGVFNPLHVIAYDEIESDAIPANSGHVLTLPNHSETHLLGVESKSFGEASARWDQGSDRVKDCHVARIVPANDRGDAWVTVSTLPQGGILKPYGKRDFNDPFRP
ncbi:MAG: hypothetical protein ABL949_07215 [Fimbriimonadaceae bacterium]